MRRVIVFFMHTRAKGKMLLKQYALGAKNVIILECLLII